MKVVVWMSWLVCASCAEPGGRAVDAAQDGTSTPTDVLETGEGPETSPADGVTDAPSDGDIAIDTALETVADGAVETHDTVSEVADTSTSSEVVCDSVCQRDTRRCAGDGVEVCAVDAAGCGTWTLLARCDGAMVCDDGVCVPACDDACTEGTGRCDGDRVERCVRVGACTAWTPEATCVAPATCSSGACAETCTDDCSPVDSVVCDGAGTRVCGRFDADACLELGPRTACDAGEVCDDGACRTTCPVSACASVGPALCADGGGARTCYADTDGCPTTGPYMGCQPGNTCGAGECGGGCTTPELVLVVDRSSSLSGPTWTAVEAAIDGFVAARRPHLRIGVRPFPVATACGVGPLPVLFADGAGDPLAALEAPGAQGATPIADALAGLDEALGDPNQAELVVLITDGAETCRSDADALAAVDLLRRRGTRVYSVAVGQGYDQGLLDAIAARGGTGSARIAASGAALRTALDRIVDDAGACAPSNDANSTTRCELGTCVADCNNGTLALSDGSCLRPTLADSLSGVSDGRLMLPPGGQLAYMRTSSYLELGPDGWQQSDFGLSRVEQVDAASAGGRTWSHVRESFGDEYLVMLRPSGVATLTLIDSEYTTRFVATPWGGTIALRTVGVELEGYFIVDTFGDVLPSGVSLPRSPSLATLPRRRGDAPVLATQVDEVVAAAMGGDAVLHVITRTGTALTWRRYDDLFAPLGAPSALPPGTVVRALAVDPDHRVHLVGTHAGLSGLTHEILSPEATPPTQLGVEGDEVRVAFGTGGRMAILVGEASWWRDVVLVVSDGEGWAKVAGLADGKVGDVLFDATGRLHIMSLDFPNEADDSTWRTRHHVLDGLAGACQPRCGARECGADGCGGVCGACGRGEVCADQAACIPGAVINELHLGTDGFVEILAPTGLDIRGYVLVSLSPAGLWNIALTTGANGGYVVVPESDSFPLGVRWQGVLRLYRNETLIDALAFGDADPVWGELAVATELPNDGTLARRPDGFDSDINALDFELTETPSPGAPNP